MATASSTSRPLMMVMMFSMMLFYMTSMVVAEWDHAAPGLVGIYNNVGDQITVRCKDQLTDLMPQRIAHRADYTFKAQPDPEETTMYTFFRVGPQHVSRISCLGREQLSSRHFHLRSCGFQEVLVQRYAEGHLRCHLAHSSQSVGGCLYLGAIQELDSCCCNEPNELDFILHEVGTWSRHQFYIVTGFFTAKCGMMN